eukprot:3629277-Rhodomonas_salina.1
MQLGGLFGKSKKTEMLEGLKETTDQILANTNMLVRENIKLEHEMAHVEEEEGALQNIVHGHIQLHDDEEVDGNDDEDDEEEGDEEEGDEEEGDNYDENDDGEGSTQVVPYDRGEYRQTKLPASHEAGLREA